MLVPAGSQDYYKLIPISGQGRTGKHSGGILTQRVRALSVYNGGKCWLTGQGVTGVDVIKLGYSGAPGPVIPWPVPPPLDQGGRYPVTCVTSLGGNGA